MEKARGNRNMIWRSVGEGVLYGIGLAAGVMYLLYNVQWLSFPQWSQAIFPIVSIVLFVLLLGGMMGYLMMTRHKRRLEQLQDSILYWERGTLSQPVPDLGEDEIGRLADQMGRIRGKWQAQVDSLQRLSADNAELAQKARFSAVIEERQRLARDLHDAVSQQLFAIAMTATALARTMATAPEKSPRQVALIEEMAAAAQAEMRALLLHLRPIHLEGKSLRQGLLELLSDLNERVPMEIISEIEDCNSLSRGIEDHLFRIVQEAISNTLRHAQAKQLHVRLFGSDDLVRLSVRDDGIGFDMSESKQSSIGLHSMQERVNEIGGTMQLLSAPGKGTRIEIRIPVLSVKPLVKQGGTEHE